MTAIRDMAIEAADSYDIDQAVRALIENTEYPVQVYDLGEGQETIFDVDTALNGRERALEFTAKELSTNPERVLELKIANEFYEFVEVDSEDWRAFREAWFGGKNQEVIHIYAGRDQEPPADDDVAETGGAGA